MRIGMISSAVATPNALTTRSARGIELGDLLTTGDGSPLSDVRDIMERLGRESVGMVPPSEEESG
jgi:hypothetical protein